MNAPKSKDVGKEARGRVRIIGSPARPRIRKHTHLHPPVRTVASKYRLHPNEIGTTEGHDVRGSGDRPPGYPEYLCFATIETVCTSVIIWQAWTWARVEAGS